MRQRDIDSDDEYEELQKLDVPIPYSRQFRRWRRLTVRPIVQDPLFDKVIMGVIFLNCITFILEDSLFVYRFPILESLVLPI